MTDWTSIGVVLAQCVAIEHYKSLALAALDYDLRDLPSDADRVCDQRIWKANMTAWKLLAQSRAPGSVTPAGGT